MKTSRKIKLTLEQARYQFLSDHEQLIKTYFEL
jgi:hypothetical protein